MAVKQLDRNGLQGNREFLEEVLMLSQERGYDEEKGLEMILNYMKNSEVRNCWKQIAAS